MTKLAIFFFLEILKTALHNLTNTKKCSQVDFFVHLFLEHMTEVVRLPLVKVSDPLFLPPQKSSQS
jgi:hypothetical protein